jgi:hypothetical protein
MLFRNALAMLTIRGEIRRLEHTRQPSDVRRTTIKMMLPPARKSIAWRRQRSVPGGAAGDPRR